MPAPADFEREVQALRDYLRAAAAPRGVQRDEAVKCELVRAARRLDAVEEVATYAGLLP